MEINEGVLSFGFCIFIDINRTFDFLKNEGYINSSFSIGRDVSVIYHNHKINQTVSVIFLEPNADNERRWQITIKKQFFIFSKIISVTDYLEFRQCHSVMEQLTAYSKFILENLMSVICGEKWTHISKCQYQKSTENAAGCVDLDDLTKNELLFWKTYSAFGFLYIDGYHGNEFNIGDIVSIVFNNYILEQNVVVTVNSLYDEWDVTIEKKRFSQSQIISVKDFFDCYGDCGDNCLLNTSIDFIKQHLMPVIRGEMWIDELLIKQGKTPPVIENTNERYVKSE